VKIYPIAFLILATAVLLASGCSRSQAAAPVSSTRSPTQIQEYEPALATDLSTDLEKRAIQPTPDRSAGSRQVAPVQVTSAPASALTGTPSNTVTRSRQPSPVSDMLYLTQDQLMRWDPLTRHAISLAQNVTDFAVSGDGEVIILLRPQKVTVNGVQPFNLDVLQLRDQQIFTLINNTSRPKQIFVSPDGSRVAYTQELAEGKSIFALPVEPGGQPIKLGVCQPEPTEECASLAWSPDSSDLLWSDALGLWQVSVKVGVDVGKPQLVHPNTVQINDPKGQNLAIDARFTNLKFAPTERFVLLRVTPLASQVGWQAVFDRRSGQLAQARDTFATREGQADAAWQSNGNLLVAHASEPGRHIPPFIHIWFVMPTNPDLLVSGQQFDLYSEEFPFSAAQSKAIPARCLLWMAETQPDHLAFAVQLDQSNDAPVLFDLNLLNGMLTKLYELPVDTTQVLWSPDGVNVLIIGGRNRISILSLKNGELIDLQPILGPNAQQFIWLPSILRR
jgi:hypothetical protein